MHKVLSDAQNLNQAIVSISAKTNKDPLNIIEWYLALDEQAQLDIDHQVNNIDEFSNLLITEYERVNSQNVVDSSANTQNTTQTSADSAPAQNADTTQTLQNVTQTPQDFSRVAVTSFTIDGVPENAVAQGADSANSANDSIDVQEPHDFPQATQTQTSAASENTTETSDVQAADSQSATKAQVAQTEAATENAGKTQATEVAQTENADTQNADAESEQNELTEQGEVASDSENTPENAPEIVQLAQPLSDVEILEAIKEFANENTDLENELLDYFFNEIDDEKRDELKVLDTDNFTSKLNELYQQYKDELNEIRKPPFNPEAVAQRIKLERQKIQDEIEAALRENGSVLENTHFILRGTQFLIDSTKEVHQSYLDSMVKINTSGEQLKQAKEELKQEISNFNIKVQENTNTLEIYKNQAHGILVKMGIIKESVEQIKQYADDSIEKAGLSAKRCQDLLDNLKDEINVFNTLKIKVEQELAVLESLEANKDLYIQIANDLQALTNTFNALYKSSLEDLKILKDKLAAQLEQLTNDFIAQLVTHKDTLSQELQTQKNEHSADLQAMIDEILERHRTLRDDWVEKQANLDNANDNIAAFNLQYRHDFEAFETLRDQSRETLTNDKNNHKNEIDEFAIRRKDETFNSLDEKMADIIRDTQQDLDNRQNKMQQEVTTFTANAQAELTNQHDTYRNDLQLQWETHRDNQDEQHNELSEALLAFYNQYRESLNSLAEQEIAQLKNEVNALKLSQRAYSTNIQRVVYTQSGNYIVPPGAKCVFVHCVGGTGNSQVTSFGNYVSAAGGAAGSTQRGMNATAFLTLAENQNVNVIVGAGGLVTISAAFRANT